MTREAIPSFDLYAELEVSRSAGVATIEAAYRSLAKRHHPDAVAGAGGRAGGDDTRIKRLNTARDWLTDPERRARYDRITGARPMIMMSTAGGSTESRPRAHSGAAARGSGGPPGAGASAGGSGGAGAGGATGPSTRAWSSREERDDSAWTSYGPNAAEVRQFLADLREIDYARALEVRGGLQAAAAAGHARARSAAYEAGRSRRLSEWLFARDAAAVIVRTRLGDVGLAGEVVEPLADAAGAIAIRDLLPHPDFDLLLLPWTWRGDHILGRPVTPRSMAAISLSRHLGIGGAARPAAGGGVAGGTRRAGGGTGAGGLWAGTGALLGGVPNLAPRPARTGRPPTHARSARLPMVALSASALGLIVVFVALGATWLHGGPRVAVVAGATDVAGGSNSNLASVPASPATSPMPSGSPVAAIDPATLEQLRAGVSHTLAALRTAAVNGSVSAAQAYLGRSAPGLLSSGLRRATFAKPASSDIAVEAAGSGWTATVGTDHLASADGAHWTFDYGEGPLARFGPASTHTLYFLTPARHEILVTLKTVSISRSSVTLAFGWTYGPDATYGNDGPYFAGDQLVVSGLSLGGKGVPVTSGAVAALGTAAVSDSIVIPGSALRPGLVSVDISVIGPAGGRIDTTIQLAAR